MSIVTPSSDRLFSFLPCRRRILKGVRLIRVSPDFYSHDEQVWRSHKVDFASWLIPIADEIEQFGNALCALIIKDQGRQPNLPGKGGVGLMKKAFYGRTLGWEPVAENKDIVFYKLNGFLFSICDRKMLADFIGVSPDGNGFRSLTIGYNVETKQEVLRIYDQLKDKVRILKEPTEPPFGGLFFYFSDVEGNVIEVAFNSFVALAETNNAIDHKPIDHL